MGRSVSIQDIAEAAGVSHTTVSRALHDSPLISTSVREQIQQLASEMGYVPNAVAQSLRGQRTNTIGLVVTTIADPFVSRVVRGIEDTAQRHNLSIFLSASYNDPDREMAVIQTFHRRRVDGVIVAAAKFDAQYEERLLRMNIPTVLINQQGDTAFEMLHWVASDDLSGAHEAMQHLISLGHREIGYLGAANRPRSNRIRLQGYREVLSTAGVRIKEDWIRIAPAAHRYHSDDVMDGQVLLPALLEARVTAVFCYNDAIAAGALMYCRSAGIRVPEEVSIMGFDDVEMAQYVTPPLTTIHQPKLRLGQTAMEMLWSLMHGEAVENHVLPTELVVRASTARPPEEPIRSRVNLPRSIPPAFLPPD